MRKALGTILVALLFGLGGDRMTPRYYHLPADTTVGSLPEEGRMAPLITQAGDTLQAWVQHASPERKPNYEAASEAGIVVWCYPDVWPHDRHVLPRAEGKIFGVARQNQGGQREIVFVEAGSPTAKTLKGL